tara:strand:+ start:174 stop:1022 length:849 start_codon:yes stop_codon:yes gene_type:complete
MTGIKVRSTHACFDGTVSFYSHVSSQTKTKMNFSIFFPDEKINSNVPGLIYLAGLTCTDETFITKAGALKYASEHGMALICPDTSPRDAGVDGEDKDWDFGTGAGFYLDAEKEPWVQNYKMYSYITKELICIIDNDFDIDVKKIGIFGHSMGGHGALTIFLKNQDIFKSVSAFAPICNPIKCPWGKKAFTNYLGTEIEKWKSYDACHLVTKNPTSVEILLDQGLSDAFLKEQLYPHKFLEACKSANVNLKFRQHKGYDHGYYFISTFMADHVEHHAKILNRF